MEEQAWGDGYDDKLAECFSFHLIQQKRSSLLRPNLICGFQYPLTCWRAQARSKGGAPTGPLHHTGVPMGPSFSNRPASPSSRISAVFHERVKAEHSAKEIEASLSPALHLEAIRAKPMAAARTSGRGAAAAESSVARVPLWLPVQRCRGVGWLYGQRGGCLGLTDSGRAAAVFSPVQLVQQEGEAYSADSVLPAASSAGTADAARASYRDPLLSILDNVAPVEVEVAPDGGGEVDLDKGSEAMYAALLLPSLPAETEALKDIKGDFLVMQHTPSEEDDTEENLEEMQLCFVATGECHMLVHALLPACAAGELLWHPTTPLLFACRSLWSAERRMRLTKSTEQLQDQQSSTALAVLPAASKAPASVPVLILSDVDDEEEKEGVGDSPSASGLAISALHNLRETFSNREALSRIGVDMGSFALHALRQTPETIAQLSSATSQLLQNASADWAAFGGVASQAAANAVERAQRLWRQFREGAGSRNNRTQNENSTKNEEDGPK
ncbi:hypothetical protein cyc_02502 [Cyclospora cayetanensis]|uniref:Uncharacterized protein n=1 Tax=Cyclospora cayetanensis TaxID=88456 RepID=A0A1D3D0V6_9EIME|nr:hypothetical protein cyc_02502 [Cyclospora cayetanensis]